MISFARKLGALILPLILAWAASAQTAAAQAQPIDDTAIAAWADRVYGGAVNSGRADAAVVAIVVEGVPRFARGYGFADAARTQPVSPETTSFRLASVSKTFLAVLYAQALSEGQAPALEMPIVGGLPEDTLRGRYAPDLTLRQVFSHQSGLEEQLFAFATRRDDAQRGRQPRFYREPGERTNYSNTATGLLGAVLEHTRGAPFAEQIQARIFAPLGMTHSRFRTDVEPHPNLANASYIAPDGTRWPMPNDWMLRLDRAASGGVEASASDMQAYMIALLDRGRTDGRLGLDAAGFDTLFAEQARVHPAANGFGMLFFLSDWNGVNVIEHGGVLPGHRAYMHLIPERGIGIFVAVTGEGATAPASALFSRWDHAAAPGATPIRPMTLSEMRAENLTLAIGPLAAPARVPVAGSALAMAGRYAPERRNRASIERALDLIRADSMIASLDASSPTQLVLNGQRTFDEIAPGVFWRPSAGMADAPGFLDTIIRLDGDAFAFGYNDMAFERIGAADDIVLQRNILLLALLAGLTGALFWIGGGARRGAALAPLAMSAGITAMIATLLMGFPANETIINQWSLGDTSRAALLALCGTLSAIAGAGTAGVSGLAIARGPGARGVLKAARYVHHAFLFAVAVGLLWALWQLRVIGWQLP